MLQSTTQNHEIHSHVIVIIDCSPREYVISIDVYFVEFVELNISIAHVWNKGLYIT